MSVGDNRDGHPTPTPSTVKYQQCRKHNTCTKEIEHRWNLGLQKRFRESSRLLRMSLQDEGRNGMLREWHSHHAGRNEWEEESKGCTGLCEALKEG